MRIMKENRNNRELFGQRRQNGGRAKKLLSTVLCGALLLGCILFAGCNDSSADPGTTEAGLKDYKVELYFANQDYINNGDEALGRFKPEQETTVKATPETVYVETLTALSKAPEKDGYATMLKNNIEIKGAALDEDGKTVIVDFGSQGLTGGSTEETFLVEQIVWTLIESFDEVKQVTFTVDGAPAESLMGHMDLSVPYTIAEVDNGEGDDVEMVMPLYE